MRWVFYGLLVVNVGFFGWQKYRVDADVKKPDLIEHLPQGVAPIILLNELDEQGRIILKPRKDPKKCDVYGPFFALADSQIFLLAAISAGLNSWQAEEIVKAKPYYYLSVPSRATQEETLALVNRLRGYQLNAELVTDLRLAEEISLGSFESLDDIERLKQKLAGHNIHVDVTVKMRDYRQYWVYVSPDSAALLTGELQSELISKFPDIFHQQKSCKPIAPSS